MRFPILFTGINHAMKPLGLTLGGAYLDVADDAIEVRMGWAFRMRAPRASVHGVGPGPRRVFGWGVHWWFGDFLVNGSSRNLVTIDLEPAARAWVGPVPLRVRRLTVSLEDPDTASAQLSRAA